MSSVQTKLSRLVKEQKQNTCIESKQLTDSDEDIAPMVDLKHKDIPTVLRKDFGVLMDMQDLMREMKESLRNDLKEMLGKRTVPEVKNSKNRKKCEGIKVLASQKPKKIEENPKIDEGMKNLSLERKEKNKPSRKSVKAKQYSSNQSERLSLERSQNFKVIESMGAAFHSIGDRCRNDNSHLKVLEGINRKKGEDELAKESIEGTNHQKSKYKEKFLSTFREENIDEGAVLRLAADFSSATLEVNKQWSNIFNILRENDLEPELLCKVKLAFKCDGEVKTFSDLQSLRKFTSQKPVMKELLKDVLPQRETNHGRRNPIQERKVKTAMDSECEAGGTSDGLSFLFIKEVKIAKSEVKGLENQEEEVSEWKGKKGPEFVKQEASEPEEEEEESSDMEEDEGEETSEIEEERDEDSEMEEEEEEEETPEIEEEEVEETSEVDEEEETSEMEGEEETSEITEQKEQASKMEEEGKENSEIGDVGEEASALYEKQNSTFQGLHVVDTKCGVKEIVRDGSEISLIGLVVESESEEEGGGNVISQIKKRETLYELKEIAFSYLVWDSEKKRLVKSQEVPKTQEETAIPRRQGTSTPYLTLYLTSPSKSLEISHGEAQKDSYANVSVPSPAPLLLRNREKERHMILEAEELTAQETELVQETEENFRRSVIRIFREMQAGIDNLKHDHKDIIDDLSNSGCILEEKVSNLEDLMEELAKDSMKLARQIIDKERLRDREDRLRSSNIRLIGVPEKDNKENEAEDIIKEVIEENFPELKDSNFEIISAHRIPRANFDVNRLTPRHILVTFWNSSDKQKILKASREKKEITYRGMRVRLTADLSLGTLDARSQWSHIVKVLQDEGFQPRILYPAKLTFSFGGKNKVFSDIEEFRKFISYVPSLEKLLGNVL